MAIAQVRTIYHLLGRARHSMPTLKQSKTHLSLATRQGWQKVWALDALMELLVCHGPWYSGMPVSSLGIVKLMVERLSLQYFLPLLVACIIVDVNYGTYVRWMSASRRLIGPSGRSCGLGILERRADWQFLRFYLDSTIQDFATCSLDSFDVAKF
ncbi:ABC transporter B family member 19-like [Iris pallida]|uniref:ABC transporter B family member 19-like n=1 Tax=Iris pallida TaxID=29817 RepID=A0AAX6F3G9_IRIPA|nr:ABC transporter B family member 19-like [Iris pallida]